MEKIKAVGLFSGGLDSALAVKLIQEQGIEIIALNYVSPFCTCTGKGCSIVDLAKKLGVEIKVMNKGTDYLKIVRNPKHGYGKNMNPCIDCKIYILKGAKKFAKQIGAKFIFTGEVVGQRPMSQQFRTLMLIEKEAGLKEKIVRPLSAGILPPTQAEKKGWISREKMLKFSGKTRAPQLDLAKKMQVDGFLCGGSGCRLTDKEYSKRIKDLFEAKKNKKITIDEIKLLSLGRHFRIGKCNIIVGRNAQENKLLLSTKKKTDYQLMAEKIAGPITILRGKASKDELMLAAKLTAKYCDSNDESVNILYGRKSFDKKIQAEKASEEEIVKYRL